MFLVCFLYSLQYCTIRYIVFVNHFFFFFEISLNPIFVFTPLNIYFYVFTPLNISRDRSLKTPVKTTHAMTSLAQYRKYVDIDLTTLPQVHKQGRIVSRCLLILQNECNKVLLDLDEFVLHTSEHICIFGRVRCCFGKHGVLS